MLLHCFQSIYIGLIIVSLSTNLFSLYSRKCVFWLLCTFFLFDFESKFTIEYLQFGNSIVYSVDCAMEQKRWVTICRSVTHYKCLLSDKYFWKQRFKAEYCEKFRWITKIKAETIKRPKIYNQIDKLFCGIAFWSGETF